MSFRLGSNRYNKCWFSFLSDLVEVRWPVYKYGPCSPKIKAIEQPDEASASIQTAQKMMILSGAKSKQVFLVRYSSISTSSLNSGNLLCIQRIHSRPSLAAELEYGISFRSRIRKQKEAIRLRDALYMEQQIWEVTIDKRTYLLRKSGQHWEQGPGSDFDEEDLRVITEAIEKIERNGFTAKSRLQRQQLRTGQ